MKISVIIPVFNVEPYVKRCLESVLAQETPEIDIECVIVDDCGRDNSMSVVRQIVTEYQGTIKIIIIAHESNRGIAAARNTGIANSTGDYVMFVDSDDYLKQDCFQYYISYLRQYPRVDVIVGNVDCFNREFLFHIDVKRPWLIDNPDVLMQRMLSQQINICVWNRLVKRSILEENRILFIEGIIFEDMTWSYWVFSHITSVLLLPKVTYVYEYNPCSITNSAISAEKLDRSLYSYVVSCDLLLNTPPDSSKYRCDMTVDYLLFINNILMRASDLLHLGCAKSNIKYYCLIRRKLMLRTLAKGRLILSIFFLLLFPPFSYMKRFKWFRHHHKVMERIVGKISHVADFIH